MLGKRKKENQQLQKALAEAQKGKAAAEEDAKQQEEQKRDAHRTPGTPFVPLEDPTNESELREANRIIDEIAQWQVENVINAEAVVRREMVRIGAELQKAKITGNSSEVEHLNEEMDSLIDELGEIRVRAEKYGQGAIDRYSDLQNVLRVTEGAKNKFERNERLTKEELEIFYEKNVNLRDILDSSSYNNIILQRENRRDKGKDFAVMYDCRADQVTLSENGVVEEGTNPFSGEIMYHDGDLKYEYGYDGHGYRHSSLFEVILKWDKSVSADYVERALYLNTLKFPKEVNGDILLNHAYKFRRGVDFPERVEGSLHALGLEEKGGGYTFPKYVQGDFEITCGTNHTQLDREEQSTKISPREGHFNLPTHIGGDCIIGRSDIRDIRLPEIIEGNLDLRYLNNFEHFECPESIGGKLILSSAVSEDENLHIPNGVEVFWL